MEIRIRETGAVVTEREFRAMHPNTTGPIDMLLEQFGADVVFEGPQPELTRYQFSMRQGVEQIADKWYTKYIAGPVFVDYTDEEGVTHTAAEQEAAYLAVKDAEFSAANAERAKQELLTTDWCENASVRNTNVTPHLTNGADFDAYRLALRAIVINPPATVETWPTRPEAVWA